MERNRPLINGDQGKTYFKLVGIGPEAQARVCSGAKVAKKLMAAQPNFYIYASKDDIRAVLHAYVDRYCDAQGD
jgi:hypothetical protein